MEKDLMVIKLCTIENHHKNPYDNFHQAKLKSLVLKNIIARFILNNFVHILLV